MNNGNESNSSGAPGQPAAIDPAAIQATAPPGSDGIQAEAPAAVPDRITLPPMTPEQRLALDLRRRHLTIVVLDGLLVALVIVFAFLAASFPIRNSDFLMHMGTGKLLSQGKFTFGEDPFSVNSVGRWVNHSWFLDLVGYQLLQAIGGVGLTILKALVVTALAAVLLMIRRPGQSAWIPAVCTGLAVLAISPRMLMQPTVLSYFFVAVTLWVLTLRRSPARPKTHEERPSWLARFASWPYRLYTLPVLFALWVNIDGWFVLGPIMVALYWLGETLQEFLAPVSSGPDAPEPGGRRQLLIVLLIGLAGCLLNPYHVYAFQVPGELSPFIVKEIREDSIYKSVFLSPWEYLGRNDILHNLAVVANTAYYPLLVLSVASFVVNLAGWRWWRALIWMAFAALAAYHVRSVPFFAVVAGPIIALNFQDLMIRRAAEQRGMVLVPSLWSSAGRVLSVLVLAVAVAATWPGWLFGLPDEGAAESRRVGWGLRLDPGLVEMAEHLAQWRREEKIQGENNAFNFHPDVANYLAFYCPEEKSAFDSRFPLFKESAPSYLKARAELNPSFHVEGSRSRDSRGDWQALFRARKITHVVLYDPDQNRWLPPLQRMEEDKSEPEAKRQWTLIGMRGRVALYAWSDPQKGRDATVRAMEMHPDARAFGPDAETAPEERPGSGPQARDNIWTQFSTPLGAQSAASFEAVYHFNVGRLETLRAYRAAGADYAGQVAAVIGFGNAPRTAMEKLVYILGPHGTLLRTDPTTGSYYSPASKLLCIRAARRALAANADDGFAYFVLGLAYQTLPENAMDLNNPTSMVGELRRCQIAGALYNAVKIQPDKAEIHMQLAMLYLNQKYLDLGLQHLQEYVRLSQDTGPNPGESKNDYRDRLNQWRDNVKKLEDQVKQNRNQYLTATQGMTQLLAKVDMAQKRGLAGQALELLLNADPVVELGTIGQLLEVQLLLRVGRVEEWPVPIEEARPDNPFNWPMLVRAATIGDYKQADEILGKVIPYTRERHVAPLPTTIASQLVFGVLHDFLDPLGMKPLAWQVNQRMLNTRLFDSLRSISVFSQEEGELTIIRGLLALEAGRTKAAAEHFRSALTLSLPPKRYVPYFSIFGTNSPLEAAASFVVSNERWIGPFVILPSQQWAVEYSRLLEEAAK